MLSFLRDTSVASLLSDTLWLHGIGQLILASSHLFSISHLHHLAIGHLSLSSILLSFKVSGLQFWSKWYLWGTKHWSRSAGWHCVALQGTTTTCISSPRHCWASFLAVLGWLDCFSFDKVTLVVCLLVNLTVEVSVLPDTVLVVIEVSTGINSATRLLH